MPRLLVIKTSSMGDLVHCLSAVAEAKHAVPNLSVDWVAEETFVEIPELYPGVDRVFPVAFRRWKGRYRDPAVREELSAAIHRFRHVEEPYDLVIDAQGLIKSAVLSFALALLAGGAGVLTGRAPESLWRVLRPDRRFTARPRYTRLSGFERFSRLPWAMNFGIDP
ncbi:MAG: hypothetical protein EBQ76_03070 [Betaproteobacteria bacterium]|nr:hypothetical protein [Betaproteobacteria bacterium]